jgi:hypothetical protein
LSPSVLSTELYQSELAALDRAAQVTPFST